LNPLREEVFQYHSVSVAGRVFQACSFIRLLSRFGFSASYGTMSRRSGFAAKADNHSDISPFEWNHKAAILEALNLLLSPERFYLRQYRLPPVQTMGTEAVEASACEGRHARFR
jgi:hypothetical protein